MLKYAIIAAVGVAAVTGIFMYGKHVGHSEGRIAQLEDIVEAEAKRRGIDAEVEGLDDYGLCLRLVRLPDQCKQLRGVDASAND